jgi:hypothetical protein
MGIIFISYAREDLDKAKQLYRDLAARGGTPWLDVESLLPGQEWEPEINRAIAGSSYFIALISEHSVSKRGEVQKEVRRALEVLQEIPPGQIFLIPARLDQSEPSHEGLTKIHWVDLFPSYEEGLRRLCRSLGLKPESTPHQDPIPRPNTKGVSRDMPTEVLDVIQAKAERDFPDDFSTRRYQIDREVEAWKELGTFSPANVPADVVKGILTNASKDFPDDFSTRLYQANREADSWRQLQRIDIPGIPADVLSTITRKAGADFPEDYSTRLYAVRREAESWRQLYGK